MIGYRRFVLRQSGTSAPFASPAAARGETLYETLERHGLPIRTTCRGSTICGLCWVRVEEDAEALAPPLPDEAALLATHAPGEPKARLACRLQLPADRDSLVVLTDYWVR